MAITKTVRVRLAPSPTGEVHIGTIWMAQFNWLFARQHDGAFVLRIEDTDQNRLVPGSVEHIYEALDWYELQPDEGPLQGGPYGPYIQSQRLDFYRQYAYQLVEQGSGYYCFCTSERLAELRQMQTAAKQAPRYDKKCVAIPPEQSRARVAAGEPAVVRLNIPVHGTIVHHDLVRGNVTFALDVLDDSVLMKSDGWPTYHLAVVVDDHLMNISHVIRAEEWLPSVPKHLLLYRAFGWDAPIFAHLPLILGSDRQKLSKRHGATSALTFRDEGFLSEAMQNFLVLMGWHPKGNEEILSRQQVLKQFRLEQINQAGAFFDRAKLEWINGAYIRSLEPASLVERLAPWWHIPSGASVSAEWKLRAVKAVRERMKKLTDVNELINFAFPAVWDQEFSLFNRQLLIPPKGSERAVKDNLAWTAKWLAGQSEPWSAGELKKQMISAIAAAGRLNAEALWPLRVALTLRAASPDVFDMLELLGKTESLRRVRSFVS
ncbi:MAG: glutamate--tRNA ligase [Candidatus Kerfeldbacteria bacterium]|nr:glutamate--tRNA ligase [Candidatus Kerfeldbacteria bacterium]